MHPTVVVLDARANLYALIDETGDTLGTGTKEVCDALAKIAVSTRASKVQDLNLESFKSHENIRSAIRI